MISAGEAVDEICDACFCSSSAAAVFSIKTLSDFIWSRGKRCYD